ncbi:type 1 fimbrial protein [Salmonella enterica]|nr:type 1 fimbrial protein [Salmonella enterica]EKB5319537.1 type 1 fimbrial protein [Salmonella enterica]ELK9206966.1 type 1 fimbrial protein [Salmonella enterica]ELK9220062.1 type 1 fimbrial protein [Salmonella enterica]ELK9221588.1 type 1 fimbrial protein [Salmonella enterica]
MKKSMAGQGVAGALLLAGLMVSVGAMAASGDPVTGGSGTVNLSIPVMTTSCSISVPNTSFTFKALSKNRTDKVWTVLDKQKFDILFKDCSLDALSVKLQAATLPTDYSTGDTAAFDSSSDPDQAFYYRVMLPKEDTAIKAGGIHYTNGDGYFNLTGASSVIINPSSDDYTLSSNILLMSSGKSRTNVASTVNGSFNYNITYQ